MRGSYAGLLGSVAMSNSYDALLVLSFGGPEGADEVVPFLRNVTKGRGIPDERLAVVGEHYFHFGGVSPMNAINRRIIESLESELAQRGYDLPVYFGNRNWHPFANEAADQLAADGKSNVLVWTTSAWGGYSACRQYDEDIAALHSEHPDITFTKLRQFYDHPTFIGDYARSLRSAYEKVPTDRLSHTRVLFTAHSVPSAADEASGGKHDAHLYSRQVAEAARLIAREAGVASYDVVWQSRSGNPATPWLEPDIVDHTTVIAERDGVEAIVVCPVGFISDHMEVMWDLDTELVAAARELNVSVDRADTIDSSPRFAGMVVDLIDEVVQGTPQVGLGEVTVSGCTVNGAACRPDCCAPSLQRHHRPTN